jgi:hypothetical protein
MTLRSDILDLKHYLCGTTAFRPCLHTAACHQPISSLPSWTVDLQLRTLVGIFAATWFLLALLA